VAAALATGCSQTDPRAPVTATRIPSGLQSRFYPPDGWTWGLIAPGAGVPLARYGVSAPTGVASADVLILTSYGEPAEIWFETARALNAKGYVVWVLEPVGQGGSGRYSRLRDLGYAESLVPDVLAARIAAERVIHRRPLVVLASGTSAPAAIQALAAGTEAEGLILTSPRLAAAPAETLAKAREMGQRNLGWLRADLHGGWSPYADDRVQGLTHDRARGRLRLAWQNENPALRMGTPSWTWITAFAGAVQSDAAAEPHLAPPVLVLEPAGAAASDTIDCRRMPHCTLQTIPGGGQALELEGDGARGPWLKAVGDAVDHAVSGFSPSVAASSLDREGQGLG